MIKIPSYLLSIDCGTTNLKCIIYDENGNMVCNSSRSHPTRYSFQGFAEQDPLSWSNTLYYELQSLWNQHPDILSAIQGISVTGQMHGPVFLSKNGGIVYPCLIWSDTRAREEVNSLKYKFKSEYLLKVTGNPIQESFSLPKILWLKNHHPDLFSQIDKIVFPKDYLGFLLTGNIATDHSDASGSLLYDLNHKKWNTDIILNSGFNSSLFPDIIESDSILGTVSAEASKKYFLPEGIPVIKGGGDLATTALATGTRQKKIGSICIGTAAQLLINLDTIDENVFGQLYLFAHCISPQYLCLGTVPTGGSSVQWFHSLLSPEEKNLFLQDWNTYRTEHLKGNILFYPYLMGTGTPYFDYQAKGAFLGLEIIHNRNDLVFSIMEGVTLALKDSLRSISSYNLKELVISGGAIRFPIWQQVISSIFNLPVFVFRNADSAAFGAFLLGARRLGFIDEYDLVIRNQLSEEPIYPDPMLVEIYRKKYKIYKQFLSFIRDYSTSFLAKE